MTETLPRIASVKAGAGPFTLAVTWKGGAKDVIDMAGVVFRHDAFAPLRDAAAFAGVQVASWGSGIEWPELGLDYGADTLAMLAEEQRPMTGAEFALTRAQLGLSQQEMADALDIQKRSVQNYEAAGAIAGAVRIAVRALARDATVLDAHYRPRQTGRPRKQT